MDENLMKIDLEDIQDLIISKKFIGINSSKYTDNALNYIKYLVDKELAILFDADTHRIYTLGQYYGGDELKENLLYFSKLLSVDVDNNILDKIDASQNSDTLAIRGKGALSVNFVKDKYNTIELEYNLGHIINENSIKFNSDTEYSLYYNEDGKISLKEYKYPKIEIISEPFLPDDEETQIIKFKTSGTKDFMEWSLFDIKGQNCTIDNIDYENKELTITFIKGEDSIITIIYSDGTIEDTYVYTQKWYNECKYGLFDGANYVEYGTVYFLENNIDKTITIDQRDKYNAFISLPSNINPIFFDSITNMQGAWHKVNTYNTQNKLYVTDNSGLGKVSWKIINKNI